MLTLHIFIKELGVIEPLTLSMALAGVLPYQELGLSQIDRQDMRISNLSYSYDVYEMSLDSFRQLAEIAESYQKLYKVIEHYQARFSPMLLSALVGSLDNGFMGLLTTKTSPNATPPAISWSLDKHELSMDELERFPKQALAQLKQYFVEPFLIEKVILSDEPYVNMRYIDGTAEFRILVTIADVALPNAQGVYQLQPLTFNIFGRYDQGFNFNMGALRTDKDRYFLADKTLSDNRSAYLQLMIKNSQDSTGQSFSQLLEVTAKPFVQSGN
ncbi:MULTISPECIES: hypothetical protein [unclassified Moraxella]|uniref:hypothetical protein n=1 Tax=unclassified Moraxella TaxID=2685852 RepID=UPI003AF9D836